jgi:hypothetical protein
MILILVYAAIFLGNLAVGIWGGGRFHLFVAGALSIPLADAILARFA